MAQSSQQLSLSQQVSNTLQALTNRPGVESTLILSRQNGSIIKVAGSLEDPPANLGHDTTPPDTPSPTRAFAESAPNDAFNGAMATTPGPGPTRAERLASDIFLFVSAASYLASSLQSTAAPKESNGSYSNGSGYPQSTHGTTTPKAKQEFDSDEVQLLRMRSKKYEIVIFPDPNFLCCVVQNMERQGR